MQGGDLRTAIDDDYTGQLRWRASFYRSSCTLHFLSCILHACCAIMHLRSAHRPNTAEHIDGLPCRMSNP